MTVQDIINSLNEVKDKSKKIYVADRTTGLMSLDIDDIIEGEDIKLIIET